MFLFLLFLHAKTCLKSVCWTLSTNNNELYIQISSQINGWVGFGVGSSMEGDVLILWKYNGKLITSSRIASGFKRPVYQLQKYEIVNQTILNNGFHAVIKRPMDLKGGFTKNVENAFMGAYWKGNINSGDVRYAINEHDDKIGFHVALGNDTLQTSVPNKKNSGGSILEIGLQLIMTLFMLFQ
eukprot:NODE_492_length_6837_cov_0.395963.p6 type:complete len:183 gc:universal NODE_492_length_6837_cov_0.395963:770-222(-)